MASSFHNGVSTGELLFREAQTARRGLVRSVDVGRCVVCPVRRPNTPKRRELHEPWTTGQDTVGSVVTPSSAVLPRSETGSFFSTGIRMGQGHETTG